DAARAVDRAAARAAGADDARAVVVGRARESRFRARAAHLSPALDACAARAGGDRRDGVGGALARRRADARRIGSDASQRALRAVAALAALTARSRSAAHFTTCSAKGASMLAGTIRSLAPPARCAARKPRNSQKNVSCRGPEICGIIRMH